MVKHDPYAGDMPDEWFRQLTVKEEEAYRKYVRTNWTEDLPVNFSLFHPSVRDERKKMDLAKGVKR